MLFIFFEIRQSRLRSEVEQLRNLGIGDLQAPRLEQVELLALELEPARSKKEKIAVHCLAGIGRTSTMLLSAHLLMGHRLEDLERQISKRNPSYVLTGSQGDFVRSVAQMTRKSL